MNASTTTTMNLADYVQAREKYSPPVARLLADIKEVTGLEEPTLTLPLAGATQGAEGKHAPSLSTLESRAASRLSVNEIRRQQNLEAVLMEAIGQLPAEFDKRDPDGEDVPHLTVDWLTAFVTHAQEARDSESRSRWARLLAIELLTPGTFSHHALATLGLLQGRDAQVFTNLVRASWDGPYSKLVILPNTGNPHLNQLLGFSPTDQAHFAAIGLLTSHECTRKIPDTDRCKLSYAGIKYDISPAIRQRSYILPALELTPTASALAQLFPSPPHGDLVDQVMRALTDRGNQVSGTRLDGSDFNVPVGGITTNLPRLL